MENAKTVNLHLSCHCRTFATTLALPAEVFPLKSAICHCSLCRYASGQIFSTFAVIPLPDKPSCIGLASFDSSSHLTRWFCTTCGAKIWSDDRGNDEWEIATGIISGITFDNDQGEAEKDPRSVSRGQGSPEGPEGLLGIMGILDRVQIYVGSTGDGGAAIWLNGGKLEGMQRKLDGRRTRIVDDAELESMAESSRARLSQLSVSNNNNDNDNLKLTAKCGCGLINLHITRPSLNTKYQAGVDACWSCRKASGFEITSWATIPISHFSWANDGRTVTLGEDVFAQYSTTPGVMRYFCKGCSAMVCWVKARRDVWDIGVGLLEIGDHGARLEDWLVWTKYGDRLVAYVEDAADSEFVNGLVDGVKRDQAALQS